MQALKAHVRNGYLVSDEQTDLPEGTEVVLHVTVPDDAVTAGEQAELEASIEEGFRDIERGDLVDARAF